MRGYFDNEEPEVEEPEELEERGRDTEVTLSTTAQLGIVFGLLLVCGLCFGLGYWVGHRGSLAAPEKVAQPATPTAAPDQEPLQGNGTIPKPSADAQVPPSQPPAQSDGTTPPADSGIAPTPPPTQPAPAAAPRPHAPPSSPAPAPAVSAHPPAVPAHAPVTPAHAPTPPPEPPASPVTTSGPQGGQPAPAMHPAFSGTEGPYIVQIAAVTHADDANVLVNALRKRGFDATAQRMPSDGLIHVRIGPFATHDEARRMCSRLLNDGYNALVQP